MYKSYVLQFILPQQICDKNMQQERHYIYVQNNLNYKTIRNNYTLKKRFTLDNNN